ncbi:uncharacterized protein ACMZJ9_000322 [Mantella aurantiaca]
MSSVQYMYRGGGLLCLLIISVSSGDLYVQRGSDITVCDMKCNQSDITLELYRQCGGEEKTLLEHECHYNHTTSYDPRLQLHTGSGCWKLTSAMKNDSCVYKIRRYRINTQTVISSTDIRILDSDLLNRRNGRVRVSILVVAVISAGVTAYFMYQHYSKKEN